MSRRCPYLGLLENREQAALVAHAQHRCHFGREPERIGHDFQDSTCLSSGYLRCPRLATRAPALPARPRPQPSVSLPAAESSRVRYADLQPLHRVGHRRIKPFGLVMAGLSLSIVVAVLSLAYALYSGSRPGPGQDAAVAAMPAARTGTEPSPTPSHTAIAIETPTSMPTSPVDVPAPILPTPAFVLSPTATVETRPPAVSPPTRLVIARLDLDIQVKPVGPKQVREGSRTRIVWGDVPNAGGFHDTSAYPGNAGNTVINGHRDIAGAVFRHLDRVGVGDEIVVYVGEVAYRYQVTEVLIVPETFATAAQRAENRALIGRFPEERLTLVTCTPVGLATHRLVVIARPPANVAPDMPAAGNDP